MASARQPRFLKVAKETAAEREVKRKIARDENRKKYAAKGKTMAIPEQTKVRSKGFASGRKPGVPNRVPTLLKNALLEAAELAGSRLAFKNRPARSGLVNYLLHQAENNPNAFMPLLGRVLPLQIETDGKGLTIIEKIEMVVVHGRNNSEPTGGGDEVISTLEGTGEVLAIDGPKGSLPRGVGRER